MLPWLQRQHPIRVAVLGDILLDEYLYGTVDRISPEAPVPVLHVTKNFHTPGGAANAARNIQLAGGQAILLSIWGDDNSQRILKDLLEKDQVDIRYILTDPTRTTIHKTRVSSGQQQLLRLDWEQIDPINLPQQEYIIKVIDELEIDVLLISDYGKGALPESLLQQIFALGKKKNILQIVDPKGLDFHRYQDSSIITPNRKEACAALGLPLHPQSYTGEFLGRSLQKKFGLRDVLVTLGAEGMVLIPETGPCLHHKTQAIEVFDVSGAGDTVASILALALGSQASMEQALHLASLAAGVVVSKFGTHPITQAELLTRIQKETQHRTEHKYKHLNELEYMVKTMQCNGKKIVFTNGCFDILHPGHITCLEEARAMGDLLIVAVNSDASIRRLKGMQRPILREQDRIRILSSLACVDQVVLFDEDTPLRIIEALAPDILVKGGDYEETTVVGADFVAKHGGRVAFVPLVAGLSTTKVVEHIRQGTSFSSPA